tara:strand:- start:1328 stop:1948 length:621 start_codon:yes stop_codon:yes gene_type:complete
MHKVDIDQGSYEWHCLRQGKVTGTTLKSALGTAKVQETLTYKMISERMTEPQIDDINSSAVSRGNEMEPIARRVVSTATGIDFIETGMLVSEGIPGFGFSPDAIALDDSGKIIGGLEIKCPGSKKHVEYIMSGILPKEYADQVKAPFLLSDDIEFWYFASYDDRNYEIPLFLIKLTREDFAAIDSDREKLKNFIKSVNEKHATLTF